MSPRSFSAHSYPRWWRSWSSASMHGTGVVAEAERREARADLRCVAPPHDEVEVAVAARCLAEERVDSPAAVEAHVEPVERVQHFEDVGFRQTMRAGVVSSNSAGAVRWCPITSAS